MTARNTTMNMTAMCMCSMCMLSSAYFSGMLSADNDYLLKGAN